MDRDDDSAWLRTCTVITTEATDAVGHIHDRMPMVIGPDAIDAWLDPDDDRPGPRSWSCSVTDAVDARGVRGVHRGQQREEQRAGAAGAAARGSDAKGRTAPSRTRWCEQRRDGRRWSRSRRRRDRTRFHVREAVDPVATLVLGHGAGGGVELRTWSPWPRRLPEQGVTVLRFEQPWRSAGKRVAVRPAAARRGLAAPGSRRCWRAVARGYRWSSAVAAQGPGSPAAPPTALGAAGVVCLSFPLHLPGRPERSRPGRAARPRRAAAGAAGHPRHLRLGGSADARRPSWRRGRRRPGRPGRRPRRCRPRRPGPARARSPGAAELRDRVVQTTAAFVRGLVGGPGNTRSLVALNRHADVRDPAARVTPRARARRRYSRT